MVRSAWKDTPVRNAELDCIRSRMKSKDGHIILTSPERSRQSRNQARHRTAEFMQKTFFGFRWEKLKCLKESMILKELSVAAPIH